MITQHCLCLLPLLAGRCSRLPAFVHSSPDKIASDAGVVLTLTCDPGYRFPGNNAKKQVKCEQNQQNQEWNDTYTECHRTYFFIYEQHKIYTLLNFNDSLSKLGLAYFVK